MNLKLKPSTKYGTISSKLLWGYFILFGISQVFYISTIIRTPVGTEEIRNQTLAIIFGVIGLSGMLLGIASFFTGLYAFFKEKERGLYIYLVLIFGLFSLSFILGELLIPH